MERIPIKPDRDRRLDVIEPRVHDGVQARPADHEQRIREHEARIAADLGEFVG